MAKKRKKQKGSAFLIYGAVFIVFVLLYIALPKAYDYYEAKIYRQDEAELLNALNSESDMQSLLTKYAVDHHAYVELTGSQTKYSTPIIQAASFREAHYLAQTFHDQTYDLNIQYAQNTLTSLHTVLLYTLPCAALVLMLLVGGIQFLNRSTQKDDFEQMSRYLNKMLAHNGQVHLPSKSRNHAKNQLAKQINELYDQLLSSIQALKDKINDHQQQEVILVEGLKKRQQEIADQLEKMKETIGKMIAKEGIYRNYEFHLIEMKMQLEQLIENLHDNVQITTTAKAPEPIDIQPYFQKISEPFQTLALEKRVGFHFKFGQSFQTNFNDFLFRQAYEAMMHFILAQCQPQTNIVIAQNQYDMIIAYKGAALTQQSIEQVKSNDVYIKTLFTIIQQMGLFLDFETTAKKDGMQFVFHF